MKKPATKKTNAFKNFHYRRNTRYLIFISFTVSAAVVILISGIAFYARLSSLQDTALANESKYHLAQIEQSISDLKSDADFIVNTIRYESSSLEELDFNADSTEGYTYLQRIDETIKALKDQTVYEGTSITLFSKDGVAIAGDPYTLNNTEDIIKEEWFVNAFGEKQEIYYCAPRLQRDYFNSDFHYNWMLPVSASIKLAYGDELQGVLLVNLSFKSVVDIIESFQPGYIYITDNNGDIAYHHDYQRIKAEVIRENNKEHSTFHDDEVKTTSFEGKKQIVVVKTINPGWKIISVIPTSTSLASEATQNLVFLAVIIFICIAILIIVNSLISYTLAKPLERLEESVLALQRGHVNTKVYIGGSEQIRRLGISMQHIIDQMRKLTNDVIHEHEQKRVSELDALQAQINPHFLYNTLDIIIWMVENGHPALAVKLVMALSRLFRLSLSKGKTIIPVADEIEHVVNYLTIQKMRYKDKFEYRVTVSKRAERMQTIKLVLQPLVENAIYHSMDYMDGDGLITINVFIDGEDLFMTVEDNGLGMTPDIVERLLTKESTPSARGSGIGLKNVDERIKLYFGRKYGVKIESEPDEGTIITLHMPAVPYEEED